MDIMARQREFQRIVRLLASVDELTQTLAETLSHSTAIAENAKEPWHELEELRSYARGQMSTYAQAIGRLLDLT